MLEFSLELELNPDEIENAVRECFEHDLDIMSEGFRDSIINPIWEWSDGELRDIVDTGEFRDSQQLFKSGLTSEFVWDVDYATTIYYGLSDQRLYPARNWVKMYLNNYYNLEYFEKNPVWNSAELPG